MRRFRINSAFLATLFVLGMTGCEALRKQPSDGDDYWFDFGGNKNRGDSSYGYGYRDDYGDSDYSSGSTGEFGKPDKTSEPEIIEDLGSVIIRGVEYPIATTTVLDLHEQGMTNEDLTEIAKLTRLTYLDLSHNQISDITPLQNLTDLERLDLSYNYQISDISPVSRFTNLTNLNLRENQVDDITSVTKLTQLKELDLGHNQVSDITSIKELTGLTTLVISGNPVSDISVVSNMRDISYISLVSCKNVSDITPLLNFKNPDRIWLWGSGISYEDEQRLKERYPDCDIH